MSPLKTVINCLYSFIMVLMLLALTVGLIQFVF